MASDYLWWAFCWSQPSINVREGLRFARSCRLPDNPSRDQQSSLPSPHLSQEHYYSEIHLSVTSGKKEGFLTLQLLRLPVFCLV